ncbi:hypothetical protein MSBRW_2827 [Methanosarcina barkeri str. Wiesmoor]|uniref:Uncharacterized protein n=2 Tax=Methanosarcina barkeri TaxID=2208 RepID=A0A0E3QPG3_METBA|nr:hypothetical protein MSBRW_2827 [Methanosarcina barkeri str. Wiesmoor]
MFLLSHKYGYRSKIELKSKYCIDLVLQPLKFHVTLKIKGSLTSEDIIRTVVSLAVDKNSIHSISKQYSAVTCETSLRYHLNKLNMDELIPSNENILLQNPLKTLKTGKYYEFAVDLTNDPYYGKTDLANEKYVIRSQAKKSTNSFYSYISLYIINKSTQYVMKNSKEMISLDIIINVKYLKGKRDKKGCENLGFAVFGVRWTSKILANY